jgi:hypothetical protein
MPKNPTHFEQKQLQQTEALIQLEKEVCTNSGAKSNNSKLDAENLSAVSEKDMPANSEAITEVTPLELESEIVNELSATKAEP